MEFKKEIGPVPAFETDLGLVFLIEFFSDSSDLTLFELGDFDGAPSLGDLKATAFLDKEASD